MLSIVVSISLIMIPVFFRPVFCYTGAYQGVASVELGPPAHPQAFPGLSLFLTYKKVEESAVMVQSKSRPQHQNESKLL